MPNKRKLRKVRAVRAAARTELFLRSLSQPSMAGLVEMRSSPVAGLVELRLRGEPQTMAAPVRCGKETQKKVEERVMNKYVLRVQNRARITLYPFADRNEMIAGIKRHYHQQVGAGVRVEFSMSATPLTDSRMLLFTIFEGQETVVGPKQCGGTIEELDCLFVK